MKRLANCLDLHANRAFIRSISYTIVSRKTKHVCKKSEVTRTCSAKYTVLPHFPHLGVPPPHVLPPVGVPLNPPKAAPYRVPEPLDMSGTAILPFPKPEPFEPTDDIEDADLDKESEGDFIGVADSLSPSIVFGVFVKRAVDVIAGVNGIVRGRPPMLRPVWV